MAQMQYSTAERNLMQQDARRRAQETRRRMPGGPASAQSRTRFHTGMMPPPAREVPPPPAREMPPPPAPEPQQAAPKKSMPDALLGGLLGGIDRDMLVLAAIAVLLLREGGEWTLLAALAYILL